MLTPDHLAISAATLEEGADWARERLGLSLEAGGAHPAMGTHNRLLSLGDLYLEVIAVDPAAPPPSRARWFDLDRFSGPPRLTNWIVRCADLEAELAGAPEGAGVPMPFSRGAYRWRMAVPRSGLLPFDGLFPALICWDGPAHPARALPDRGLSLRRLEIHHPEASALDAVLAPRLSDPRITILPALAPALHAEVDTPRGVCQL